MQPIENYNLQKTSWQYILSLFPLTLIDAHTQIMHHDYGRFLPSNIFLCLAKSWVIIKHCMIIGCVSPEGQQGAMIHEWVVYFGDRIVTLMFTQFAVVALSCSNLCMCAGGSTTMVYLWFSSLSCIGSYVVPFFWQMV